MARMYSRKRGKSGSTKPEKKSKPSWLRYKGNEVELLVTKFAKERNTSSQIGQILRDSYGIPDVKIATGKSITTILSEKNMLGEIPEDLLNLMKRLVLIKKHLELNKKDMPALRGFQLTDSKIKRLVKYYKNNQKLPIEWTYDLKSIRLLAE